ncbi:ABC transporter ATP-binding protein [Aliinostoc sp. HNIBRCY26]|uniref:ABC transporter ATP-binding protein n=1 Tax=Aliinostoc sp. HNIBRCY26 TaxID=3418997 RepID=UPI003D060D64
MTAAVLLENVYKFYNQVPVVNDLSFTIKPGEIFALLGPNGAGKSTTIRMLTTLTKPSQGRVEVAGYDVVRQPMQAKQNIGVVLQSISVDGQLTVWENLELYARLRHIANPQRQQLINQWLEYVELANRRDSLVKTLSGGMKRRLQIARALLHQPQILFLDEPTVGLDPQTRRRLWEMIRDLNKQGMTILLTTHYMDEVEFLCDAFGCNQPGRIGIMDGGKLISLGTLQQLRSVHGEGLVMKQLDVSASGADSARRWEYLFFPSLAEANSYLDQQTNKTGMMVRPSNLEDIFVELTGRELE